MGINRAIRDAKRFITTGGFNVEMTLEPPVGDSVIIQGLATRRTLEFDQDGYPVNSSLAHVLLVESSIVEAGVTVRNARGEVALENHLISWTDGTGTLRKYKIVQTLPSETVGLITCKLGRYGTN